MSVTHIEEYFLEVSIPKNVLGVNISVLDKGGDTLDYIQKQMLKRQNKIK